MAHCHISLQFTAVLSTSSDQCAAGLEPLCNPFRSQLSLAMLHFAGIGGYTRGFSTTQFGFPYALSLLAGALAAARWDFCSDGRCWRLRGVFWPSHRSVFGEVCALPPSI